MGIQGLMKLLAEHCPRAIREYGLEAYNGRRIAIDASMTIYQFLIAIRSGGQGYGAQMLTNDEGEVTSHIQGLFNRAIRLLTAGIKPVYVFDGSPPRMKTGELMKRSAKRQKAEEDLKKAEESGSVQDIDKYSKRLVHATREYSEDCKLLLQLMGLPIIQAPCEAEAQCAELAKSGLVYATSTEDMDALTFASPKLVRHLSFAPSSSSTPAGAKKDQAIVEIDLSVVYEGLDLDRTEFTDLCILCGCDYCDNIRGIGPKTALSLIQKFRNIEAVLRFLDRNGQLSGKVPAMMFPSKKKAKRKYDIPNDWWLVPASLEIPKSTSHEAKGEADEDVDIDGDDDDDAKQAGEVEEELPVSQSSNMPKTFRSEFRQVNVWRSGKVEVCDNVAVSAAEEVNDDVVAGVKRKREDDDVIVETKNIQVDPSYIEARNLFLNPIVTSGTLFSLTSSSTTTALNWSEPVQEVALRDFLVNKKGFNAERVDASIKKLMDAKRAVSGFAQQRMENYFKILPSSKPAASAKDSAKKNKKSKK